MLFSTRRHGRLSEHGVPGGISSRPMSPARAIDLLRTRATLCDCLVVTLVALLTFIPCITGLGFYSDDWSYLGYLSMSRDQSIPGLYDAINSPQVAMRPVQLLYTATLYRLFGLDPLGYHIVNSAVFLAALVLLYLTLREVGLRRSLSLPLTLVYATLPSYSTDRFWVAVVAANLSLLLYLLSLYAALRMAHSRGWGISAWLAVSLACMAASVLAYEVVLPLFLLHPLLAGFAAWRSRRPGADRGVVFAPALALGAAMLLTSIPLLIFKAENTTRLGSDRSLAMYRAIVRRSLKLHQADGDYGLNFVHALRIHIGEYVLLLPHKVWISLTNHAGPGTLLIAALLGLGVCWYVWRITPEHSEAAPERLELAGLLAAAPVIFVLGHAIFLTNENIILTATGIGNRTEYAAALGVAPFLVAVAGLLARLLPHARVRRIAFSGSVAAVVVSGFLVLSTIAGYWTDSYRHERDLLTEIRAKFPTLEPGSTLILDGVCPYDGPAIVFESSWDLQGALFVMYGDWTLRADVVSSRLTIGNEGITTRLYGVDYRYPYDPDLVVFNVQHDSVYRLDSEAAARHYFQVIDPDLSNGCAPAREGVGEPVF